MENLKRIRRLFRDRSGSILIELAAILPVVALIALGGIEVSRYVLLNQKLDRVAGSTSDLVSQAETITDADVNNLFQAAQFVAKPFEMGPNGVVIVSSVSKTGDDPPIINWQRSGGGSLSASSALGSEGDNATLPPGFNLVAGENVIIAEVLYDYEPWPIGGVTSDQIITHLAYFRPRFGTLTELAP